MACTANGRSRAITNTPTRPPASPRTAPAKIELRTSTSEFAVVGEGEQLRPQVAHRSPSGGFSGAASWPSTAVSGQADDQDPPAGPDDVDRGLVQLR